ncbi:L-seryl-tRNA(Sec) selenium transferase [Kistimonas scapharcae]|uniref:L-seryl-tRNA(Sec) selenium transferase n=1 Tax=Kistimonas scapharcae TaxID=1036133 RepID=A0ABP8V5W6_9GAMM
MSANPKGIVRLPQVEQLLQEPILAPYIRQLSRPLVTDVVRRTLAAIRQEVSFRTDGISDETLYARLEDDCRFLLNQRHARVINATGTVVHTNLGRSPIDPELWDSVADVNTGYCNLEIKLSDGKRGQRKGIVSQLLSSLTGAEEGMVVNNNAASVYLLLNELARGKEVIVSRGEQIQIGGGFRIPDILALSGAKLVEVGTTNITTADDYINAVTENTAMVLMVHCSNFVVRGFTESPDIREVARRLPEHVILAVDQGSGLSTERFAANETPSSNYIRAGADLVCFSGDKILGGPQAGIICGRKEIVQKLEKNPLMRAFRPGRMVYSLLEELLVRKLNRESEGQGVAEKAATGQAVIQERAQQLASELGDKVRLLPSEMVVGGGTLPDEFFPSWSLELQIDKQADQILADLRAMPLPVIGVIRNDRVQLNMAAILPREIPVLTEQLRSYLSL